MAKISKKQQQTIGFMVMWAKDFAEALNMANVPNIDDDEFAKLIDKRDWYAHMAVSECEAAGMDPLIVLNEAMVRCADYYRANKEAA